MAKNSPPLFDEPSPARQYKCGTKTYKPSLRRRTYDALRTVIDNKTDTLRNIAEQTGLEWGWLRMFSLNSPPDPGVNKIETLYYYLTGRQL